MDRTRIGVLLLALILTGSSVAARQLSAECSTSECVAAPPARPRTHERLWQQAAAIHQLKLAFVDALQRFTRAQAGTFGDEGGALQESVAAMQASLDRWDRAVQQFQADAGRLAAAAEVHVAVATVLLDRQRPNDAVRELRSAERLDSNRADIHTLYALAYDAAGKSPEATRALRNAAALERENPVLLYRLVDLSSGLNQSSEASRAGRDLQRALARARAGRVRPDSKSAQISPFERVDLLRQTSGVAPIFPQARYVDGFLMLRGGDYAAAVAVLSSASAGDPLVRRDQASAEMGRAASLVREGRLDAAVRLLSDILSASPDSAETHRLLGLAYWLDDQKGKSIESLRSAIRLAPGDERARVMLADVLADERRFAEAQRELTQALESGSRSGLVWYRLAQLYERQSVLPEAAKAFRQSEAFGPVVGRDEFYRALGALLVNQADFDGAVTAYRQRLDVNPNSAEAHRQLADIYFLQGRDEEALSEFLVAAWLDPNDARAHAGAGQAQVRMLKYADATASLSRALTLEPSLREARYALGTSLLRLGKAEEARRELALFGEQQAEAEAVGQHVFQLDALRREGSRQLLAGAAGQAILRLQEALTLEQSARSHRDLGLALLRARRAAEAIEHLAAAQKLEETAEGFAYLADAFAAAGNAEAAAQHRALYGERVRRDKLERVRELGR